MKIVICDDERLWIEKLTSLLKKYLPREINYSISDFTSGEECLKMLMQSPADLLFMDIEMDGLSGIDIVRKYKSVFTESIVFFVTSHTTYFTDLFRLGSFQCLLKPIDENDFKTDLLRAVELYKLKHTKIEVKADGIARAIELGDILFIEVYKKCIRIRLNGGELTHSGNITYYENKLAGCGFIKTHKSFLVNLNHIRAVTADSVVLDIDDITLPLSRNYRDCVKQAFAKKNFGECL